eukprot:6480884-Amphidinium_carterae.1
MVHAVCFVPGAVSTSTDEVKDEETKKDEDEDNTPEDKKGGGKLAVNNAAKRLPVAKWTSSYTNVVWRVRWGTQGLTPVRPVVVTSRALLVKAGKAVTLK